MRPSLLRRWQVDDRVLARLRGTGFDTLHSISDFRSSISLIKEILEFYDPVQCCFTFNDNITLHLGLEDIYYITGLPINGEAVIGIDGDSELICREFLGDNFLITYISKKGERKNKGTIALDVLRERFSIIPPDVSVEALAMHKASNMNISHKTCFYFANTNTVP